MIICMIDVKMKLHLCKEPDKFQFVVLAHNMGLADILAILLMTSV